MTETELAVLRTYADAAGVQIKNMSAVLLECRAVIGALDGKMWSRHQHLVAKIDAVLPPPPLKGTQFRTGTEEVSTPESVTDSPSRTSPDPKPLGDNEGYRWQTC